MTAKNLTVHHFLDANSPPLLGDAGLIEIEEMHEEVRQAVRETAEACDDGAAPPVPSYEEVADRYVRMVERVPVMVELLRDAVAGFVPKAAPSWWYEVRALLREVDGE